MRLFHHHEIEPRHNSGGQAYDDLLRHLITHPSDLDATCAECARLRDLHLRQLRHDLAVTTIEPGAPVR